MNCLWKLPVFGFGIPLKSDIVALSDGDHVMIDAVIVDVVARDARWRHDKDVFLGRNLTSTASTCEDNALTQCRHSFLKHLITRLRNRKYEIGLILPLVAFRARTDQASTPWTYSNSESAGSPKTKGRKCLPESFPVFCTTWRATFERAL